MIKLYPIRTNRKPNEENKFSHINEYAKDVKIEESSTQNLIEN